MVKFTFCARVDFLQKYLASEVLCTSMRYILVIISLYLACEVHWKCMEFHPMGMLYCCHVTGKLTPKPLLIRNNGIMSLRLRFRGHGVHWNNGAMRLRLRF